MKHKGLKLYAGNACKRNKAYSRLFHYRQIELQSWANNQLYKNRAINHEKYSQKVQKVQK